MAHLYEEVLTRVVAWKADNYSSPKFPAIAEILEWAHNAEAGGLRFLRRPQLQALELRYCLPEGTPGFLDECAFLQFVRTSHIFFYMMNTTVKTAELILQRIDKMPVGEPFAGTTFLGCGTRASVESDAVLAGQGWSH